MFLFLQVKKNVNDGIVTTISELFTLQQQYNWTYLNGAVDVAITATPPPREDEERPTLTAPMVQQRLCLHGLDNFPITVFTNVKSKGTRVNTMWVVVTRGLVGDRCSY